MWPKCVRHLKMQYLHKRLQWARPLYIYIVVTCICIWIQQAFHFFVLMWCADASQKTATASQWLDGDWTAQHWCWTSQTDTPARTGEWITCHRQCPLKYSYKRKPEQVTGYALNRQREHSAEHGEGFKIQDYFIISSEKLKRGWTLTTSQYTGTHILYFKTQRAVIENTKVT